jgi:chemotaxis protein CheD
MYITNIKYGKPIKIINAGEFHVSGNDEFIETLLGSCVAVCLHDPENGISGMNHFMLPGRVSKVDIFKSRSAQYGIIAIQKLLDEMISRGAKRKNLVAKVFGGGSVLSIDRTKGTNFLPMDNVRIAKAILEMEDIPIDKEDVGEIYTRKLLMDVPTGRVYVKRTTSKEVYEKLSASRETSYDVY